MADSLSRMECVPCSGDAPTATKSEVAEYMRQLSGWQLVREDGKRKLQKAFTFKDFASALAFAHQVGERAEEADHHPAILVEWGRATVSWWTHVLPDLHRNDFIMAARTDECYGS